MRLVRDAALSDFEWDEAKRKSVLEVRGIDFADVAAALLEPTSSSKPIPARKSVRRRSAGLKLTSSGRFLQ